VGVPLAVLAANGLNVVVPLSEAPWAWLVCMDNQNHSRDTEEDGEQMEMYSVAVKGSLAGEPEGMPEGKGSGESEVLGGDQSHSGAHFCTPPTMGTAAAVRAAQEDRVVTL
jgi:hypothetical protein